jgi:hypothetical protein
MFLDRNSGPLGRDYVDWWRRRDLSDASEE